MSDEREMMSEEEIARLSWGLQGLQELLDEYQAEDGGTQAVSISMGQYKAILMALAMSRALLEERAPAGRLRALEKRIGELEAGIVVGCKFLGIWQRQVKYPAGSLTTFKGSLWHANVDTAGVEPGDGKSWTLCAKGDDVPLAQRDTAGKRITGKEPPRKPRKVERTVVTAHDKEGRIAAFEKEIVEE